MIFVKALTYSDLTIIERFWRKNMKQEAIVVHKSFIKSLGDEYIDMVKGDAVPMRMTFWGPGSWPPLVKDDATIHRQTNDWRIQECSIKGVEDKSDRFGMLEPGDTLFVFSLKEMKGARVGNGLFVSSAVEQDKGLYNSLLEYKNTVVDEDEVLTLAQRAGIKEGHALYHVITGSFEEPANQGDLLEDALQGGEAAVIGRAVLSREDLESRNQEANRVGRKGEEIFEQWLETCPLINGRQVVSFEWVSDKDCTAPYDFSITFADGELLAEVKSTKLTFAIKFYISRGELEKMSSSEVALFRLSDIDSDSAKLRYAFGTKLAASSILSQSACESEFVKAINFEIQPELFEFMDEIEINSVAE